MLHLLQPLLLILHLLVLLEMLNVLRVRQVLELGVLVVVQLPVVNLIFVFVVPVVARAGAEVGQHAMLVVDEDVELVPVDDAVLVVVDEPQHLGDNLLLSLIRDVLVGLVHQPVRALDLGALPLAVRVEVVQRKEGGGVEVGRVVLLWGEEGQVRSAGQTQIRMAQEVFTGHVSGHPVGILSDHWLLTVIAMVAVGETCAAEREDGDEEIQHV